LSQVYAIRYVSLSAEMQICARITLAAHQQPTQRQVQDQVVWKLPDKVQLHVWRPMQFHTRKGTEDIRQAQ
jgi:hypothetical protein